MLARTALRSAAPSLRGVRAAAQRSTRTYSSSSEQVREFFHARPVPIEAYPLIGITLIMCSFAGYHLTRHIVEDRDHLRWKPTGHHAMAYSRVNDHAGSHLLGGGHN